MMRVSGPEYVSIHKINDKTINIFGDEHWDKYGECDNCKNDNECKTIPNFLKDLERPCDIILEAPYATSTKHKDFLKRFIKSYQSDGYLGDTLKALQKQLYNNKHSSRSTIRVHYGDMRYHPTFYSLGMVSYALRYHVHKDLPFVIAIITHFKNKYYIKNILMLV
jgi:hypothetical protein